MTEVCKRRLDPKTERWSPLLQADHEDSTATEETAAAEPAVGPVVEAAAAVVVGLVVEAEAAAVVGLVVEVAAEPVAAAAEQRPKKSMTRPQSRPVWR